MARVHAQAISDTKTLVDRGDLDRLIEAARRVEEVEVIEARDDLPATGLMALMEERGAFEYLLDPREDVYSVNDLKVRYR
jgi:hypothetical protein